jgi:signal transduction histidine kinase
LAREKEITLQITPSQDLPAVLSVDGNKLELILSNLISNALRYVPNQTGIVALRAEKQDNKICFWVDDNGPGIPDPEKGRIFERFYKGAGGGTGLGLYIAKELAGQLQATLTLEPSKELGGASFAVCVG